MPLTPTRVLLHPPKRYALSFDGENDYVEVSGFDFSQLQNGFTFVMLLKTELLTADIISHVSSPKGYFSIRFLAAFRRLEFATRDTVNNELFGLNSGDGTVDIERYVWAALTWDTIKASWWINGVLTNSANDTRTSKGMDYSGIYIGRKLYTMYYLGQLALLQVYNRALTDSEIQHNYLNPMSPITDGLVLWLKIEEGSGTTVHDYSGYGNHGTIHGASWFEVSKSPVRLLSPTRVLAPVR